MSEVLASISTFVGTVLVAGLGWWQWRRTRATEAGREYREQRISALESVFHWWVTSARQPARSGVVAIAATRLNEARTAFSDRYAEVLHGDHV